MYAHFLAYRHPCGEVEGFRGGGFTKASAKKDAINQILRKLEIVNTNGIAKPHAYDTARLIETPIGISIEDLKTIRRDWKSNVRY
jgi:hypothetical protein